MSFNTNAALNSILNGSNVDTNTATNLITVLIAGLGGGGNSYKTIRTVQDFVDLGTVLNNVITIPSDIYIIDARALDLGDYTLYCNGDLVIMSYSQLLNKMFSTKDNKDLIVVENGSLFINNIELGATGIDSQCIVMDGTLSESLDMFYVSFSTGSKFGTLTDIRQGYWEAGFSFEGREGFTLEGDFSNGGFTIFNTKIINCGGFVLGGTAGLSIKTVRSNVNADVEAGSVVFSFDAANFTGNGAYQLNGCQVNGTGLFVSPFTTGGVTEPEKSVKSFFSNNQGNLKKNTFIGAKWDCNDGVTSTTLTANVETKLLGTTLLSDNVQFDANGNNSLRYLNTDELTAIVQGYISLQGTANTTITVKLYKKSGAVYTLINENSDIIENLAGGTDIGNFNMLGSTMLTENDEIEVWAESPTNTSVILRTSSFVFVSPK